MKNLLFVAFQFPPFGGGSAVHRATRFARYLGENGWRPYVLTANPRVYESTDPEMEEYLPPDLHVTRAFALNARRHLAVAGRHFRWTTIPDPWFTWMIGAIPRGLGLIYRKHIDAILVTFPITTTVCIGLVLHWLTGKPLVVDFRDPMTEEGYPRDPLVRKFNSRVEALAIRLASRFIFTTPLTRQMHLDRYPQLNPQHCVVISNGYDEEDFAGITTTGDAVSADTKKPFRIVHSGLIYPDERDPRAFFKAIQRLKQEGLADAGSLQVDLRASGADRYYADLARQSGIEDVVRLLPELPHKQALQDTARADGLLLFQGPTCSHQIPGKAYEYVRLNKPILAVTTTQGDTATLLRDVGGATIAEFGDENLIYEGLRSFLASAGPGRHPLPDPQKVSKYTRRNGTKKLAHVLDRVLHYDERSECKPDRAQPSRDERSECKPDRAQPSRDQATSGSLLSADSPEH